MIFSTNVVLNWQNEFTHPACVCLGVLSGFAMLLAETLYGNTTVVGDGAWHRSHACDDARGGVIGQDIVGCFAVLSTTTQDEDFPITN